MSENDNIKIQKITELLEKGGTMLANHHSCGAPMFRYQGQIVCPVCMSREEQDKATEPSEKSETLRKEHVRPEKRTDTMEHHEIALLIRDKIKQIAISLENETDLQRVKDEMECIEQGIRILKLLEDQVQRKPKT